MLRLHNTLSKSKEEFIPLDESRVTLYTCGPTVYSYPQVGNWIAYIRWDTLVRTLGVAGYSVDRVMNITDVGHLVSDEDEGEDKMQKGARRDGITAWDVAERYTDDFLTGMNKLNLIMPTHITKATDFIPQQIKLIQVLEQKGYTYKISDGIYFDTSKFSNYRTFAGLDLEGMQAGARVSFNDEKRNPSDFALWKFSPEHEKRDMEWESPWGKGFPGWHVECSAMAMEKLGETIDIHTGGIDHIPVHHTNEIAQSEAATGKQFSRYWLHNNFLTIDGSKLSKSLGNSYTLQDLEQKGFDALDFRMLALQSHYRTEANFTWDNLQAAHNRLKHWKQIAELLYQTIDSDIENTEHESSDEITVSVLQALQAAQDALLDDMNTPQALVILEEALDLFVKTGLDSKHQAIFVRLLDSIDAWLGLNILVTIHDISDELKEILNKRTEARIQKDWATSDELRDVLNSHGVNIRDGSYGTVWESL